MENKKITEYFSIGAFIVSLITLGLSLFYNSAFIPSFILMFALFIFSVCYLVKDTKKNLTYVLFTLGVLLIIGSLVYTYLRLR